jgi:hypothetical protein
MLQLRRRGHLSHGVVRAPTAFFHSLIRDAFTPRAVIPKNARTSFGEPLAPHKYSPLSDTSILPEPQHLLHFTFTRTVSFTFSECVILLSLPVN